MPSPKKLPNGASLTNAFNNLDIAGPSSPTKTNLSRSILQQMKSTFMSEKSIRVKSVDRTTTYTIAMDDAYDYNVLGDIDPDDLYEELARHMGGICELMRTLPTDHDQYVETHLVEILTRVVFGSNMIEKAGAGWDVTLKLCQAIFRGDEIPNHIGEADPEYAAIRKHLSQQGLPTGTESVLRSRHEVIQHAKAASYIIGELYLRGRDLTEEVILETHRILTHQVDTEQGMSWTQYSGVYRHDQVIAGLSAFPDPSQVPRKMKSMITSMNRDLQQALEDQEIDPVAFAAKYCHTFVNIHPFLDGNGRTCRLILNALLLKYGGGIVHFGEQEGDRKQYLGIAVRASESESSLRDDWEEGDALAPKHYRELASFTLMHFTASMKKLAHVLKRDD